MNQTACSLASSGWYDVLLKFLGTVNTLWKSEIHKQSYRIRLDDMYTAIALSQWFTRVLINSLNSVINTVISPAKIALKTVYMYT